MVTNLFTGIGFIPTNTHLRGVDVTINGDGHYAGVDVYGPPQRLATYNNYLAGVDVYGPPQQKVTKIHLRVVGILQAILTWVVMPGEQRESPRWG